MATHAHSTPAPTLQRGPQIAAGGLNARARLTHRPDARLRLEAALERWIAILDEVDGDCDLEEGGDLEPSLASTTGLIAGSRLWPTLADDDRELDTADDEPSLGSTNSMSQLRWAHTASDDLEAEHDGREPDCDAEPEDAA